MGVRYETTELLPEAMRLVRVVGGAMAMYVPMSGDVLDPHWEDAYGKRVEQPLYWYD